MQRQHQEWVDLLSGDLSQNEIEALGLVTSEMQKELDLKKAIAEQDDKDRKQKAEDQELFQNESELIANRNKMYT